MRTTDTTQHTMFSYQSLEEWIPAERLLRVSPLQVLFSFRSERQLAQWKRLISHEHFTVDDTLIEA